MPKRKNGKAKYFNLPFSTGIQNYWCTEFLAGRKIQKFLLDHLGSSRERFIVRKIKVIETSAAIAARIRTCIC